MIRFRRLRIIVVTLFLSLNYVPNAHAGSIVSSGATQAYARATLGQSFLMPVGESGNLTTLTVPGIRGRGPQNVACVVAKMYTNSSKTTLLQTSTNTVCDTDATGTEMTGAAASGSFEFGNQISLSAGTQYFFELSTTSGASALWTSQSYVNPGGGYSGGQLFADGNFLANYDMAFTLVYTTVDTTPPTFPSADTFNVAENSTSVSTITTSESATITIFGGEDQAKFSISRLTDSSTALSFIGAPNYEAPTDVGANNTYVVVFRAIDDAANVGYETVTVTVTDVVDTSAFNSFALAGSVTTATYRTTIQINANVTVAAKVTFSANNIRIAGCINVRTTGTSPNIVAVCNWKPSRRGPLTLTAAATPTGAGISSASATPIRVLVVNRTGSR